MKYLFAFIFCLLLAHLCRAQQRQIDSLKTAISKHPQKDTLLADMQIKLGHLLVRTDQALAMKLTDQAIEISNTYNWKPGLYKSLRQKGVIYTGMSEPAKAITYQLRALKEIERDANANPKQKKQFIIGIYINIAIGYNALKLYDKSLEYSFKAIPLAKELKNERLEGIAFLDLGLAYMDKGVLNKADSYLDSSYYIANKYKFLDIKTVYFANKAEMLTRRNKFINAINQFKKCILYADSIGDNVTKSHALNGISEAYMFLKNYQLAEKYTKSALILAEQAQILQRQYENQEFLSRIYEHENKPVEALAAYKKYVSLKDSSIGEEKKIEITRREMQYEADKKETLQKAEIDRQKLIKNAIVIGLVFLLLFGAAVFILYKKRRDALQIQKDLEAKAHVTDVEMKVLRLQLNPHFIFNSLNSISNYINKNDLKTADYFLAKFARLMRSTLENSEEKEISLAEELKMIEWYMQLEAARMDHKFDYKINIAADIDPDTTMIPPLILQPFVENSIWHGLAEKDGKGHILIEITHDNDLLNCVVADDGVGRAIKPDTGKKSFGMKITSERIALLNKFKNTDASIHLIDLDQGTRVEINLPFETES